MPIRLSCFRSLGVVNDGNESVSVPPNVEDHVSIDVIGVLEHRPYFREIVPADHLDDARPGFNFTRCTRVLSYRFAQMPAAN